MTLMHNHRIINALSAHYQFIISGSKAGVSSNAESIFSVSEPVMTPLALAREWARGEPGLGLYLGCLAIRFVKITLKYYVSNISSTLFISSGRVVRELALLSGG